MSLWVVRSAATGDSSRSGAKACALSPLLEESMPDPEAILSAFSTYGVMAKIGVEGLRSRIPWSLSG